ncbi:hypothetical protein NSND_50769 [Nitrospira sp. ND1]|nr:hypothetical protein NSND_50769 [Nitrospira sp. ND1]
MVHRCALFSRSRWFGLNIVSTPRKSFHARRFYFSFYRHHYHAMRLSRRADALIMSVR